MDNQADTHMFNCKSHPTTYFFQNEGIFVQLDKLDELDEFIHA